MNQIHQYVSFDFYLLVFASVVGLLYRPSGNFLELRYAFAITFIMGLCGESLLVLFTGVPLDNVFTVPRLIPLVQRYATVCAVIFWSGYHLSRWWGKPIETPTSRFRPPETSDSSRFMILLAFACIPLFLDVLNYGFGHVFGTSDVARGYYARLEDKPMTEYLRVLGKAITFPTAVVAGVAWQQRRQAVYWVIPVLLSIPLIAYFSRGMFLPFAIFLLGGSFFLRGSKQYKFLLATAAFTLTSFLTGMAMRHYAEKTGLALYSDLLETDDLDKTPVGSEAAHPLRSVVEATAALSVATKVFEVGPKYEANKLAGYVLVQLPIPSFALPKSIPKTNLADDLQLHGARFPYPLMGEMRVFFGWAGCLVYFLIGLAIGRVDRAINDVRMLSTKPYLVAIFYGLGLFFVIREFHSGLRSSLRPTMYFTAAWFAWRQIQRPAVLAAPPKLDGVLEAVKLIPRRHQAD